MALSFCRVGRWLAVAAAGFLLAACAYVDPGGRERLLSRAAAAGWDQRLVDAGAFTLFTAHRAAQGATLTVYIEGDGRAWEDPYTPSDDPTPVRPVALRLALADTAPNVLYVARPCQYRDLARSPGCETIFWTTHRLAPQVLASLSSAIDRTKRQSGAQSVELIGYSGGGAAAALLAARRDDVVRLVTLAANLDLGLWARAVRVRPLVGSLDPASEARKIASVPQRHLVGGDDEIVVADVVQSFLAKAGLPRSTMEVVRGQTHECCWHEDWATRIGALRTALSRRDGVQRPAAADFGRSSP